MHVIGSTLLAEMARRGAEAAGGTRGDDDEWSTFQARLERAFVDLGRAPSEGDHLWTPEDPFLAQLQAYLAKTACEKSVDEEAPLSTREVMYDDTDWLGWTRSFFDWWRKLEPAPFRQNRGNEFNSIPNNANLVIFGDWGSGRYGAPVIARTVQAMTSPVTAVIHLGDTYYAGTPEELQANVLAIWPRRSDAESYLMNGNHERYGGDLGYYDALDQIEQPFSYFALENDHYLFIALDSAWEDAALAGNQVAWVRALLDGAGDRKVVLLTHHEPFSAFENGGGGMMAQLDPFLSARRIHAWIWGHEHRCVLYQPHPRWGLSGRCVGHGGYPYFRVEKQDGWTARAGLNGSAWYEFGARGEIPAGRILGDANPYVQPKPNSTHTDYGAHGFLVLSLDGPRCVESYRRPDGEPVLEQEL
jgi:hypothetical protein